MKKEQIPEILSIGKVSELLGVSLMTLRRWDKDGTLPSFRPGNKSMRRYRREDVLHFISEKRDGILTPKQQDELITALKGRKEIPLKFVYIEEGSKNWDKMVQDKMYGLGELETSLIEKNIDHIYEKLWRRKFNIVDIGPGNGKKAIPFIERFSKNYEPVHYIALDISQAMIKLALQNIKKYVKQYFRADDGIIDFEEGNFSDLTRKFRKEKYPNNLFLLLGNTAGNPFDKDRVLTNIRESMVLEDFLLIGIELADLNNVERIVAHYKQPVVLEFVFFCLKKLGFNIEDGEIAVQFNKEKSQIEMRFVFTKTSQVIYNDETIEFEKNDSVLLLISYKSTRNQLEDLLERTGFKISKFMTNENKSYAIVLCRPQRY